MDAGAILTTQAQLPSAAETSSDVSREDAEAFAAHLPQETQAKPAPRKPAPQEKEEVSDEDAKTAPTVTAPSFSLTSPVAPVLVRENGAPAVLDIALTPTAAPAAPQTPTPATPLADAAAAIAPPAALNAPTKAAAPATGATPVAPQAAPVDAAAAAATTPQPATTPPVNTAAQPAPPAAEVVAAALAAPAKAPAAEQPLKSLRSAGRSRGGGDEAPTITEAKAVTPAAATTQAGARADAKPDFVAATASAPTGATDTAPPPPSGDAAAVSLEARRAAEAPPVAVHRPPTVAATVAQHVIRRFDGKSTSIDVRLDPAELGKVSVKLEVGPDSRVTAIVAADNPATLSDLMRSARELERALESAGLELSQGGLSFDLSGRSNGDSAPTADAGPIARAGNDNAVVADAPPVSRPFGLESWRGVRVDVTV